jgi:hypothetical protein
MRYVILICDCVYFQGVNDGQMMSPGSSHEAHSGHVSPGDPHSPSNDTTILMYPGNLAKTASSPSIETTHHHDNKGM